MLRARLQPQNIASYSCVSMRAIASSKPHIALCPQLAAAVVYIAARLAQLPLTAVDVALTIRIPTKVRGFPAILQPCSHFCSCVCFLAALSAACRSRRRPCTCQLAFCNSFPFIFTKAFGRVFCSAVAALGLALPVTPPHVFLRAAAHKLCRSKAVQVWAGAHCHAGLLMRGPPQIRACCCRENAITGTQTQVLAQGTLYER